MDNRTPMILIVDDAPVNLKMLARGLENEGYKILTAENGPDARALAAEHQPELIILDILMPGESGFECMKLLKQNSVTAGIPVIFVTGEDRIESKLEGFELGAVDYITKPFYLAEVKARVRLHLRLSVATNALIANQAQRLNQLEDAQSAILEAPEDHPKANFGRIYNSYWEAGGDFYDVVPISDAIHGYFLGDVSGHDISTSFVTSALKVLLKQNCKPMYQPLDSMRLINQVLLETLPPERYMTAAYLQLNRKRKQATVVDMGHLPMIYQPKSGEARLLFNEGDILGAFPQVTFGVKVLDVSPGDRFVIFSDGLMERAREERPWTDLVAEVPAVVDTHRDIPINDLPEHINKDFLNRYGKPDDDVVVLATEV